MEQVALLEDGEAAAVVEARRAAKRAAREAAHDQAAPRLVEPNRKQIELRPQDLESLLPPCHRARAIWAVVERLDLSRFYDPIKARGSRAGRAATDPRVLVALWLYATSEGVGSAHELERLCTYHDAYRWLRGGVPVNYHTLSDFRTEHEEALDELFTQLLAVLTQQGLVSLKRVAQDGMRVRASAGASSFRRRQRLEEFLQAARAHVQAVKQQGEAGGDTQRSVRQQKAQQRAAQQRAAQIENALAELAKIEQQREEERGGHKAKGEPRASTTDAEARKMKMGDGGFRPAFNAQLATDTESRVIVGVSLTENGTDYAQAAPMVDQIERRTGTKPEELLVDGGFTSKEAVDDVTEKQVTLYGPVPERKGTPDPYAVKPTDSEAVRRWKERMATEEAKRIYRERAATAETVNGDLRAWRSLDRFLVRGKRKVLCVLLWNALTYNILRWVALAPGVLVPNGAS
jgi:transposase